MILATPKAFLIFSLLLIIGVLVVQEIGRKIGIYHLKNAKIYSLEGTGIIESGIFAIWGLLLAFTFSGAANRLDMRRELVGIEVNAMSTAYLRLELIPKEDIFKAKTLFHEYLDLRIASYANIDNEDLVLNTLDKLSNLQKKLWTLLESSTQNTKSTTAAMLVLPAFNSMFDIVTTRFVASQMHPPTVVYFLILLVSYLCAMIIGYKHAKRKYRSWFHILSFILVNTIIVYVILDMEFPRLGLIRVDDIDKIIVGLKQQLR